MAGRVPYPARLPGIVDEPATPREGFRGPQVCALVGITYRQLDYWARTGLLRPSITDARGSGTQRRYSYHDVLELKVIKQLLDAGISLQRARRAVECLRDGLGGDLASTSLVLVGADSVLAHGDGEVVDLLRGGQGVLNIVPLSGVVEELDAAITDIAGLGARAGRRDTRPHTDHTDRTDRTDPHTTRTDASHPDSSHLDASHPDSSHPGSSHLDSSHTDSTHPARTLQISTRQNGGIGPGIEPRSAAGAGG